MAVTRKIKRKLENGEIIEVDIGALAKNVEEDETRRFVSDNEKTVWDSHVGNKSNPHGVTKAQVGLGNVNNTADAQKPVSAAQQKAIDDAYANSNYYTDEKIADLINGAPTTLDTLKEIADAMDKNQDVVEALDKSVGSKVDINGGDISYTVAEFTEASALSRIQGGEMTKSIFSKTAKAISALISHISTAATTSVLGHVRVDSALSSTSTNPVQNKAVNSALAGKLSTSGNASNTTSTFTEASSLTELVSGEKHGVSMGKLKLTVKNVIAIAKLLGNTDISKIGGGTVTGAIAGINSSLGKYFAYEGTDHNLIVPASVFNISRAQLEATDIPEGYYTVINLLKHPNNTEGVQYAIGYFGGDCVGKMFYRTFANHQVTSQFKEVAMCNGTESINVSTEIRKDDVEAFSKANFIASKPPGSPNMCGYGFHNAGTNGCILYYSETDSHLHILNNVGRDYVISMTEVSK